MSDRWILPSERIARLAPADRAAIRRAIKKAVRAETARCAKVAESHRMNDAQYMWKACGAEIAAAIRQEKGTDVSTR